MRLSADEPNTMEIIRDEKSMEAKNMEKLAKKVKFPKNKATAPLYKLAKYIRKKTKVS